MHVYKLKTLFVCLVLIAGRVEFFVLLFWVVSLLKSTDRALANGTPHRILVLLLFKNKDKQLEQYCTSFLQK